MKKGWHIQNRLLSSSLLLLSQGFGHIALRLSSDNYRSIYPSMNFELTHLFIIENVAFFCSSGHISCYLIQFLYSTGQLFLTSITRSSSTRKAIEIKIDRNFSNIRSYFRVGISYLYLVETGRAVTELFQMRTRRDISRYDQRSEYNLPVQIKYWIQSMKVVQIESRLMKANGHSCRNVLITTKTKTVNRLYITNY